MKELKEHTHISASQIKLFQTCPRKWAFKYLYGIKEERTEPLIFGNVFHTMVENYINNKQLILEDDKDFTKNRIKLAKELIQNGIKNNTISNKLSNNIVEHPIHINKKHALYIYDKLVKGYIDLMVYNNNQWSIQDHKTTSNFYWALKEHELKTDTQMILYAKWLFNFDKTANIIELRHNQFNKRTKEVRVIKDMVTREHVNEQFNFLTHTVKQMKEVEDKVRQGTKVEHLHVNFTVGNMKASEPCGAFGGCPFITNCMDAEKVNDRDKEKERKGRLKFRAYRR